jgi:hypothetical protein
VSFPRNQVGFQNPVVLTVGTLIIEGTADGIFVYNGTPSLGNPPIFALTLASEDKYGNTVNPGAVTDLDIPFFFYSGTPTLGNLIASISNTTGVDAFGNDYFQGIWTYGSSTETGSLNEVTGASAALNNAQLIFREGTLITGGAIISALIQSASPFNAPQLQLESPLQTGVATPAVVTLLSGNTGGTSQGQVVIARGTATLPVTNALLEVIGTMALDNESAPSSAAGVTQPFANSGHLDYVSSDGNVYDTGRLTLVATGAQVITNASNTPINGWPAVNLGIGTYKIKGQILYSSQQAAGRAEFSTTGTAASTGSDRLAFTEKVMASPITWGNSALLGLGATAGFVGTPLANGANYQTDIDGILTITTAGTFQIQALCSVAGDTFTILFGTSLDIIPVVA